MSLPILDNCATILDLDEAIKSNYSTYMNYGKDSRVGRPYYVRYKKLMQIKNNTNE